MFFKFLSDKRVKRIKSMWNREKEVSKLFERKYIEERNKRIDLESRKLNEMEIEYVKRLVQFDRILNSHNHTSQGLYSELNTDLFEFTDNILRKL